MRPFDISLTPAGLFSTISSSMKVFNLLSRYFGMPTQL